MEKLDTSLFYNEEGAQKLMVRVKVKNNWHDHWQ